MHLLLPAQEGQKAGIKFKQIAVPSATEIIKASSKDAIRLLDSVPPTVTGHFKRSAEQLVAERALRKAWLQPWPAFPGLRR